MTGTTIETCIRIMSPWGKENIWRCTNKDSVHAPHSARSKPSPASCRWRLQRGHKRTASGWGLLVSAILAALIVAGSRNLEHFDAALVGYTFATLFATSASPIATRCGCSARRRACTGGAAGRCSCTPRFVGGNLARLARAAVFVEFAANRFIFRARTAARRSRTG